jgi:Domain of unknown function (DUF4166)
MRDIALFPGLLGDEFSALDPSVRALHAGSSGRWLGTATVHRGKHPLLRVAGFFARLPTAQRDVPTVVEIEAYQGREVWTRQFGTSPAMRSTLRAKDKRLVEQMGLLTLRFRVLTQAGAMVWNMERIAFLGIGLPQQWFRVMAGATPVAGNYRFDVSVDIVGLGELIRYEGLLEVPRA